MRHKLMWFYDPSHKEPLMPELEKKTAPYLPFKTLLSSIESLAPHVPNNVERSLFDSQSGAMQSAIMVAFRFLGLIDTKGTPSIALHALVDNPDTRKEEFRKVLERAYPELIALGLAKATPKQLDDAMEQYGVTGSTHQKAVTFFLQAAAFSGIPLSQYITRRKARMAARRRGTRTRLMEVGEVVLNDQQNGDERGSSSSRTVELRSGGSLTLGAEFDPFIISAEDRTFIFGLIDQLAAYERGEKEQESAPMRSAPRGRPAPVSDDDVPF